MQRHSNLSIGLANHYDENYLGLRHIYDSIAADQPKSGRPPAPTILELARGT